MERELDGHNENLELKDTGWRFCKIVTMTIYFYKTDELNGCSYVKILLSSSSILNIENDDNYCLLWSIVANFLPCENSHPNRVSNYREYVNELNIDGLEFSNGYKTSDVERFEKMNN